MKHRIEKYILDVLIKNCGNKEKALKLFRDSSLIRYLNLKSSAIHGNSKSRRSLAAWYSIYSIAQMYLEHGFYNDINKYKVFHGFKYMDVFQRQKTYYSGKKLQNHALNSRTNDEFISKVTHDPSKNLILKSDGNYWLNPDYLYVDDIDISKIIIEITDNYIKLLKKKDNKLLEILESLKEKDNIIDKFNIIDELIDEDSEARIFEIISYAVLYSHFNKTEVYFGWSIDSIKKEQLKLYKTGRTNANDGGIDFVMKPLGRFFQVTEVDNYDKYLLDLDKILFYPMTFVVKTTMEKNKLKSEIIDHIKNKFGGIKKLEDKYVNAIEEVITINELKKWLNEMDELSINEIIQNIDKYYKLEFDIFD